VDPDFLTFYLGSPAALRWLVEHATGSAIQHVNAATLRVMPLWLPTMLVQRAIVEILDPFQAAAALHGQIGSARKELHDLLVSMLMAPAMESELA